MKIFDAVDLQKRTGWRLEDCDEMVEQLKLNNLCIIDNTEEFLTVCKNMEDDGK